MNELVKLEEVKAVEVFSGTGMDELLQQITDEAKGLVPDTSTTKGRKEIASMAAKVAKSKTYLDGLGKDLVSDWKTQAKKVDDVRKSTREYLDNLKAEVRKPLTEWEDADYEREQKHKNAISQMLETSEYCTVNWMTDDKMDSALKSISATPIDEFEEYAPEAARVKDKAVTDIKEAIAKREAYDKEQAELETLRAESAKREKAEAEEKLRKEGEERATREAEQKAKAESEAKEKELQAAETARLSAIKAKEEAQRKAIEAEEKAKSDAIAAKTAAALELLHATQAERDRIEQERIEAEQAEKAREADKKHRTKINNAAVTALVAVGLDKAQAKSVVIAIAKSQIPQVKISY